ncbi:MAG: VPLPA-CTERM sorting domain-containing protein [Litoreibacter sp.]|nr:VPLPA-CTERM sorting domain-containing protein [Litoreibacter sp.]
MSIFRVTLAAGCLAAGVAQAGVVDFTDGFFEQALITMPVGTPVPTEFVEEADGVRFTVTPQFQDNVPRPYISSDGLTFGPQGSPLTGLSIVPDQDIVLTSLEGRLVNAPQFFFFEPRIIVPATPDFPGFAGRPFVSQTLIFDYDLSEETLFNGTYTLAAGSTLFIDYFTDQPGDGCITRLFFNGVSGGTDPIDPVDPGISAVPLPASGLLLLFGLGGIAGLRHAKRGAPARQDT